MNYNIFLLGIYIVEKNEIACKHQMICNAVSDQFQYAIKIV